MSDAFNELKPVFDQLVKHTEAIYEVLDLRITAIEKQLRIYYKQIEKEHRSV